MWHGVPRRPARTFRGILDAHLDAAFTALGTTSFWSFGQAARFVDLLGPWSRVPVEDLGPFGSFAANDEWPVELSFAFARAGARLRVLVEEIAAGGDPLAGRLAGQEMIRRLGRQPGVDIERYVSIEDLFFPTETSAPRGDFSLMHAVDISLDGSAALHKVYLNPAAAGRESAAATVATAMRRLGLAAAWARVTRTLAALALPPAAYEAQIVALDLDSATEARVKVYLRHHHTDAADIDRIASVSADHRPGVFEGILRDTFGRPVSRLAKPPLTALSFVSGHDRPTSATLYCPLYPNLPHDAAAGARLGRLLDQCGIATDDLAKVLRTVGGPAPEEHRRISWFGYKRPDNPVVTVYAGLRDPEPQGSPEL
ncbi:tryptophan dimethylallyltransferase family protein [Streptomyces tendae]|uniref:tryptophan dimethylallyltransferase family protein n=1 Tax=Streptomyces tendae TaxID=1932 RepID=UPI0037B7BE7B